MFDYFDLLGKQFGPKARGPNRYDCFGLVKECYKRLGKDLPELTFLKEMPDFDTGFCHNVSPLIEQERKSFIELKKAEPYCIVLFSIIPPFVSHIGMVLEDKKRFIHILPKSSVSIEKLDSSLWKQRIRGFVKWGCN